MIESMERSADADRGEGRREKSTFQLLFAVLAVTLLILPVVSTFNEFLTRLVERSELYRGIERFIVPTEAKLVAASLLPFGWEVVAYPRGLILNGLPIYISWNCVGWQSLILLLLTFVTGFQGRYRAWSVVQTLVIGLLGTFLVNILRIALVAAVAVGFGRLPAVIFHDYFSTLFIVAWLVLLWWFSYRYVLRPRHLPSSISKP